MGNVGQVIMFVLTLAGTTIVALYLFVYCAWVLREVIEAVASGNREMAWSHDPFADKIGFAMPLLGVLVVWLMPSALIARSLRQVWLTNDPNLRFLVFAIPGLWLVFPVGILSTLTSNSQWAIVRPTVIGQLLRLFPSTLMFYLLTGVGAGLLGLSWYVLLRGQVVYLLVTAPLSAAMLLVYGRLLGRLAWLLGRQRPKKQPKKKEKPPSSESELESEPEPEVHDPWDTPEEEKKSKRKRKRNKDRQKTRFSKDDLYGVGEDWKAEEPDEPQPESSPPAPREKPKTQSVRAKIPPPPKRPVVSLFQGTFTFPFRPSNLGVFVTLSLGFALFGFALVSLLRLAPV